MLSQYPIRHLLSVPSQNTWLTAFSSRQFGLVGLAQQNYLTLFSSDCDKKTREKTQDKRPVAFCCECRKSLRCIDNLQTIFTRTSYIFQPAGNIISSQAELHMGKWTRLCTHPPQEDRTWGLRALYYTPLMQNARRTCKYVIARMHKWSRWKSQSKRWGN